MRLPATSVNAWRACSREIPASASRSAIDDDNCPRSEMVASPAMAVAVNSRSNSGRVRSVSSHREVHCDWLIPNSSAAC